MKDKLLKLLKSKEERKAELKKTVETTDKIEEIRSANVELEGLNSEIAELRSMINEIEVAEKRNANNQIDPNIAAMPQPQNGAAQRSAQSQQPQGGLNILGTYGNIRSVEPQPTGNLKIDEISKISDQKEMRQALFSLPEYRTAYLKALSGRNSQSLSETEKRALTIANDSGGAAVPTTTYDMIIKRLNQTSALFPLISKTFIPGNVVLPVANPETAADWDDNAPSTDQDDTLGSVSLGSFPLSKFAKVKAQLSIMSIDAFESYIVGAISDQIAIAIENAIANGLGPNPGVGKKPQPTGILTGITWGATNSATYSTKLDYDDLVGARALLKSPYRKDAKWIMNSKMEAALFKIKTTTNQPLFTQNPVTGLIANPLGIPYIVDDYMPDNVVLLANLNYYYMNFTQNPTILSDDSAGFLSTSRIYRGTLFADGKPALDEAFVKLSLATAGA